MKTVRVERKVPGRQRKAEDSWLRHGGQTAITRQAVSLVSRPHTSVTGISSCNSPQKRVTKLKALYLRNKYHGLIWKKTTKYRVSAWHTPVHRGNQQETAGRVWRTTSWEMSAQQRSDLAEVKLTKYTRLTVGQLKCTSDFSRQITSAGAEISHERECVTRFRQTLKYATSTWWAKL